MQKKSIKISKIIKLKIGPHDPPPFIKRLNKIKTQEHQTYALIKIGKIKNKTVKG
jgi:hypothetical protein